MSKKHKSEKQEDAIKDAARAAFERDFGIVSEDGNNQRHEKFSTIAKQAGMNRKKDFRCEDFSGTVFKDDRKYFEGTNFRGTNLSNTTWENTSIRGALMEGANLYGAKGLTVKDLATAYSDDSTILPEGISRKQVMSAHEALKLPPAPPMTKKENEHIFFALEPKHALYM